MDFTLSAYKQLILALQSHGYFFQTFEEYIKNPREKVLILRHDVDRLPGNSLVIAKIEKEAGIKASYYFRIVKESYDEDVIKQIAEMGHEIAYHYENLAEVSKKDPHPRGIRSDKLNALRCDFVNLTRQAVTSEFHRAGISQINAERKRRISHRPTQTNTDVYPADPSTIFWSYGAGLAGQKESSLREKKEFRDELFELAIDDFRLNLEWNVKTTGSHLKY